YDIYWIVDFDEGYVYFFTDGNGDTTCDKVKIVSGHLNDRITVTWHDGGEQWSWYLHFKYVNSPVTLVVNDHNGFVTEFSATDLYDAIAIRDAKNIKEY
ncbi:MAG: PASTA domain-containing protein, partial [Clostridia bacterium]|nr:PASTA domain-containing protein [Clostridia bacterium]